MSNYKSESERTEEDRNALVPPFRRTKRITGVAPLSEQPKEIREDKRRGFHPEIGERMKEMWKERKESLDHDAEADRIETEIRHENYKLKEKVRILTEFLSEAWTLGATHEQPSFGQLNSWRHAINK